ncbi:MAG: hypothetical protein CMM47_06650 [Rhodospirillaceae bacterium]|nr:hypothetical protein [Rhodospirillaceae bacterium]
MRFVDCDMHVMEPADLFDRYLNPAFRDRVIVPINATGKPHRGAVIIDGLAINDDEIQQHRKRNTPKGSAHSTQQLSGSRIAGTGVLDFAIERDYDARAQIMGMEMEGIDIAVLFPTAGFSYIARNDMDAKLSLAICQAYNDWIHEFTSHSPDQL